MTGGMRLRAGEAPAAMPGIRASAEIRAAPDGKAVLNYQYQQAFALISLRLLRVKQAE